MMFRITLLNILLIILLSAPAWAAPGAGQLYIIDYIQVGVRQNPSNASSVMETLRTGAKVTRLSLSDDQQWVKIRTQAGAEGWVMMRYLMENPPAAQILNEMPRDQTEMLNKLRQENSSWQTQAQEQRELAAQWQRKYERLERDSHDIIALRKEYDAVKSSLEAQTVRLRELEAENSSLNFTSNIAWFLAGGSVLLLGWFLGWLFGKRKRSGWASYR
jgi:SH3 domain protein